MPRKRSQSYHDQREQILAKTAELFANNGYQGTSMSQIAQACTLSKASLYHYITDKYALLVSICESHVIRLEQITSMIADKNLSPEAHLQELIKYFVEAYADAKNAHRVLIAEAKFLNTEDSQRIYDSERRIVATFAKVVNQLHPELTLTKLTKPLTMLLFGMINWMFTWLNTNGALTYQSMAPLVAEFFLGGINRVTQHYVDHKDESWNI